MYPSFRAAATGRHYLRTRVRTVAVSALAVGLVLGTGSDWAVASLNEPLVLSDSGSNAVSVVEPGGQSCATGGSGNHRHVTINAPLPADNRVISAAQPGTMTAFFLMSHDGDEPVDTLITGPAAKAYLRAESGVTLTNARGSVRLKLVPTGCAGADLYFNGFELTGAGAWTVDPTGTTGSYHPTGPASTSGSGVFTLAVGVRPDVNNRWNLTLNGNMSVPQPALSVVVAKTAWANLGDYLNKVVTVSYRVTNTGPGDSFAPALAGAAALAPGVQVVGPLPQNLPDLPHGQSVLASVRYKIAPASACLLVVLACGFDARVSVLMPDVLDKADAVASVVTPVRFPLGPLPF